MTSAAESDAGEQPRSPHRTLFLVLAGQFVVGAALLIWVALGRPVPGLAGPQENGTELAPVAKVNRFDGARAWKLLERQVKVYGPRPAGSDASRRLATELAGLLPAGYLDPVPGGLQNVIGELPGKGAPIVVGAHYDTAVVVPNYLGANDGAAGVAAVVELARVLKQTDRGTNAPPIRFVLYDGEELPPGVDEDAGFEEHGLRGSKADAAKDPKPRAMVLLDYIAEKHGMRYPRERNSDAKLWSRLRAASRTVGTQALFPRATDVAIIDDHVPYIRRGIPSIDLIDFNYPQAHTRHDDLAHVSERSLDASGETVLELLRSWK